MRFTFATLSGVAAAAVLAVAAPSAPAQAADIVQTAQSAGQFTMLLQAVRQAGLEPAMRSPGPFTVFAPTDAAFRALPPAVMRRLMDPRNRAELRMVLGYHVLPGRLTTRDVGERATAADTLGGLPVIVNGMGAGPVRVNDATITQGDMQVDNGVVHVIDRVLMPPMPVQPRM